MLIGITGSFGSGKTTVTEMFGALGARVIDADIVCHKLMLPDRTIYKRIIKHFGKKILGPGKRIDRIKLADIVFNNTSRLMLLNRLVHPETIKEIEALVLCEKGKRPVVVEGALLVESGFYKKLDIMIVVKVERRRQVARLTKAKAMTKEDALKRLRSQTPLKKKLAFADFVIDNGGSKNETRTQVKKIWKQLGGMDAAYDCKSKTGY
ncbi:MAG: dephospho-CoA kinase [Candidatus Omnitrophica bacterium]|nr:dephospho-CoA kinase [Candidatus Omnitrophota bacterium]